MRLPQRHDFSSVRLHDVSQAVMRSMLAERVVPVTGASGKLASLAKTIGCPDVFGIPNGVGGRFSVFTAVGLSACFNRW